MSIEIKNRFTGALLICGEYESVKDCLQKNRGADLSGADLSGADLSRADLSRADLSGADLFGADLSGADLSRVSLSGADLSRADLSGADLSGADLSGADLSGADLSGANLCDVNLSRAYLSGVKNIKLPIISIAGSIHSFYYRDGNIRIGCEYHTVKYWLEKYEETGKENNYTPEQIAEYKRYIDIAAQFMEGDNANSKGQIS